MRNKIISGIGTAVVMLLTVIVLLAFGYDPPDPPIPEEGVEVNLGDSDFGAGSNPQPTGATQATQAPASPARIASQNTETAPNLGNNEATTSNVRTTETPQPKVENKEPEINKNALFPGKRNQQNGNGSQGTSSGSGDQGKPNGTPTSNNYSGNGGGNGNYSLAGRSSIALPKPEYNSNKQGTVVIQIWVGRDGRVVRAEYQPKGSNTQDGTLVQQALAAARKARFNADAAAPDEQKGTITYKFEIN